MALPGALVLSPLKRLEEAGLSCHSGPRSLARVGCASRRGCSWFCNHRQSGVVCCLAEAFLPLPPRLGDSGPITRLSHTYLLAILSPACSHRRPDGHSPTGMAVAEEPPVGITAALACFDSFPDVFGAPSLGLSRKRTVLAGGRGGAGVPHLTASALQPRGACPSKNMRIGEGEPVEIIYLDT